MSMTKELQLEIIENMETLLSQLREAVEKDIEVDEYRLNSAYCHLSYATPNIGE
jgi:hypothetical protein